ncbi:MAG: pantetheine-phosphate adenylyltransferase [Actinomycetota bacterium]|nr:pantetheine-phosphate adenylyltransferase [Actinomycetota bacterium]|tara:strand:+ start:15705 stop:16178 length:474 start_codon:yes stop_codon:yes gene_type:complete
MKALIPGSFDPPTLGHLDIINRSIEIFHEILIGVVTNPSKKTLFSSEDRVEMLMNNLNSEKATKVEVKSFDGLLVDFAKAENVDVIVKGVRAMTDFDYEFQMAQVNKDLDGLETLFVPAKPEYGYVSSSLVKEIFRLDGDVSSFVTKGVLEKLNEKR